MEYDDILDQDLEGGFFLEEEEEEEWPAPPPTHATPATAPTYASVVATVA